MLILHPHFLYYCFLYFFLKIQNIRSCILNRSYYINHFLKKAVCFTKLNSIYEHDLLNIYQHFHMKSNISIFQYQNQNLIISLLQYHSYFQLCRYTIIPMEKKNSKLKKIPWLRLQCNAILCKRYLWDVMEL